MHTDQLRHKMARPLVRGAWFFSIVLLSACATQQDVHVTRQSTRSFAPTTLVQVLASAPSTSFVRIATLDVNGTAGTPKSQLLAQLQAKAGELGANAIIVRDLSSEQGGSLQYDPAGGNFVTAPSKTIPHLRAIAIRVAQ